MQVNHMDSDSKEQIIEELKPYIELNNALSLLVNISDGESRIMLSKYLAEFARRRNILLGDVFSKSFIDWINR